VLFNIIGTPVTKLEGEYWTQRNTTGTGVLHLRTTDLLDDLPTDLATHPMAAAEPNGVNVSPAEAEQ